MDAIPAPAWLRPDEADAWRTAVAGWTADVVAAHGWTPTGPPSVQKAAPWSIVLRLPTSGGTVWFKQNVPTLGPEPALLQLLAELVPGRVPTPLGADPARGWVLLPDQGPTLRALGRDGDPELWLQVLGRWAQVGRDLAPHAAAIQAVGVPRLAAGDAGAYLQRRVAELSALPGDHPAHLAPDDASRLATALPGVRRAADQLAALGLPDTLWHNDLHTNNVFGTASGPFVYFDLGDALIGSPLADLLIPLRVHADARGSELGPNDDVFADPILARIVEAAIEPWTDVAPAPALRAAVPAALTLATLGRSESWRRAVPAGHDEYGDASTAWLLELVGGSSGGR